MYREEASERVLRVLKDVDLKNTHTLRKEKHTEKTFQCFVHMRLTRPAAASERVCNRRCLHLRDARMIFANRFTIQHREPTIS